MMLSLPKVYSVHSVLTFCEGTSYYLQLVPRFHLQSCLLYIKYQELHSQAIGARCVDRTLSCPCLRSQVLLQQQHAQSLAYIRDTCGNTPGDRQTTL